MSLEGAGPLRVIEPPAPGMRRAWAEVLRHRSALGYFTRRFVRNRYARTFLGILWLPLRPLLSLGTRALVFGGILGISAGRVPYFLYFVVASSAWHLFAETTNFATRSLEMARSELRRLYVPRLIPLTASMSLPLTTLVIYLAIALCAVGYYLVDRGEFYLVLRPATLLAPCGFALLVLLGLAIGLWTAPIAARARDIRWTVRWALGIWYFLTPVIYPIDRIPEGWRFLASLNPVTAPVELVKEGLLDVGDVTATGLAVFSATLLVVGGAGLRSFTAKERRDVVHY